VLEPEALTQMYREAPPIVKAAVDAILMLEERVKRNEMGYQLSYFQSDLPQAVIDAIAPWKAYDP
jgi:hypothetical protein